MPPPETPEDIQREIRMLEVRMMALGREKEELLQAERRKPWWFRVLREIVMLLWVAVWIAAFASVLAMAALITLIALWRPR